MSSSPSQAQPTPSPLEVDMQQAKYFAAAIAGLIAVFIVANWSQVLLDKFRGSTPFDRTVLRPIRRLLIGFRIRSTVIRPGRVVLAVVYIGILFALLFTNIDVSQQIVLARRLGWMALCNLCLTVFLAVKNTPLSPLAGRSYDSLNVIHRACGYTTIILTVLHVANFVHGLYRAGRQDELVQTTQYVAAVAAISLAIIGVTALRYNRKRFYELFFVVHVTLVTLVLITVLLHVEQINWSAMAVVVVSGSIWFADRSLRLTRWIYRGWNNHCILTPLPGRATKVTMKTSIRAQPGSHAFLWIPQIRAFQTHPFSLASSNPAEFVASAQEGFTRALYDYAVQHPGAKLRAAIEGPYGNSPDVADFDRVILLSGGSGVTFNLSLAMGFLKNRTSQCKLIDFVWTVKTADYLDWFERELRVLESSPSLDLRVYLTSAPPKDCTILPSSPPSGNSEEAGVRGKEVYEKHDFSKVIHSGRPNVGSMITDAISLTSNDSRVLVAASGPKGLLDSVRFATRACMAVRNAPNLRLHLEEFDW